MAFRRFYESPIPEAIGMPHTMQALSNLVATAGRQRQADQTARRNALAQYKEDHFASKFNSDQEDLNLLARDITTQAVNELSQYGTTSPQVAEKKTRALGYKNQSDAQWQMLQDIDKAITSTEFLTGGKNYYNPAYDTQRLLDAAYGKDGERVTWMNRGDRLQNISRTIGTDMINSFDKEGYLSDYVQNLKSESREKRTKGVSGIETSSKIDAVFLNKDGVPQVTDEHAIDYLSSSPYVATRYQQELNQKLLDEAQKIKASPEGAWTKDLSDEQIIAELRNNPSKNTINRTAPGVRERELARMDLEKKQRQNISNSYDAGGFDADAGRGITSKFFTVAPSFDRTDFGGSGGKLTSKSGDRTGITISLKGPAFDTNANDMTGNDRSARDFKVNSYNLLPIKNGVPVNVKVNSTKEYIDYINKLPLEEIANMQLKTVIKGQAFNKPEILSNARVKRDVLAASPDQTEETKNKIAAIDKVLEMSQTNPDLEPEVLQSALRSVLGTVVEDLVKVVEPRDPETIDIQNKLGQFNITDPKNYSSDDKAIADAWNKRKAQAEQKAKEDFVTDYKKAKLGNRKSQPKKSTTRIKVKGPDGKVYTVPIEQKQDAIDQGYTPID